MILVVNMCKEKLSYDEFVKPITNLLKDYEVKHFSEVKKVKHDKVILTGCPLQDKDCWNGDFSWLKEYEGKILGICAGMQVLGSVFGSKLKKCREIGMIKINEEFEAYTLHNYCIEPSKEFEILYKSKKCVHGIKHKEREFYGVLFHPEVRNLEIIEEFVKN